MRERISILQILKTTTLIPILMVLAIIVSIYTMVKKGEYDTKQGAKIIKRRIEILLKKNPLLVQNINKIVLSIFSMIQKANNGSDNYIIKLPISNKSIELDSNDDSNSDIIKLKIYTFEIDGDKILKDCTGFSDLDDFIESLGYDEYYDIDEIKGKEVDKITEKIKNIIDTINLINSCMKEQYKGVIKLDYTFEEDYCLRDVVQNKSYIIMKINGNINNMNLPVEFKEKIKNIATKIKL